MPTNQNPDVVIIGEEPKPIKKIMIRLTLVDFEEVHLDINEIESFKSMVGHYRSDGATLVRMKSGQSFNVRETAHDINRFIEINQG